MGHQFWVCVCQELHNTFPMGISHYLHCTDLVNDLGKDMKGYASLIEKMIYMCYTSCWIRLRAALSENAPVNPACTFLCDWEFLIWFDLIWFDLQRSWRDKCCALHSYRYSLRASRSPPPSWWGWYGWAGEKKTLKKDVEAKGWRGTPVRDERDVEGRESGPLRRQCAGERRRLHRAGTAPGRETERRRRGGGENLQAGRQMLPRVLTFWPVQNWAKYKVRITQNRWHPPYSLNARPELAHFLAKDPSCE